MSEGVMTPARTRVEYWFLLIWGVLLRLALIAGLVYAVYRVRFIIVTVLLAAVVAFAIEPLVRYLDTRRAIHFIPGPTRRLLVTFFVFFLVVLGLVVATRYILDPVVREVSQFFSQLPEFQHRLQPRVAYLQTQYARLPEDLRSFLAQQDFSNVTGAVGSSVQHLIQRTWESTWRIFEMILIPVLAFYFVLDGRSLKREFIFLVPRPRVRETLTLTRQIAEIMRRYVIGQAFLAVVAGVVVGTGLHLLGVNYALALGVWAAITRVIPVVGPWVGGIPVVLLATAQSWEIGVGVLIFFTLVHLFESQVLMPKVIGYHMQLHPAIIIIVLLIGSEFFGLIGMFLAAPVAAIIKVLINHYIIRPQLRRYGRIPAAGRWDDRSGPSPRRKDPAIDVAQHSTLAAHGSHPGAD